MAPFSTSNPAVQPSAAISRPTTRSVTAAASALCNAANCANVRKRKLEDTASSGPAAKRTTRRAAASGPATTRPTASGPAARGPAASGPAAKRSAKLAANTSCKRKREEESYAIPTKPALNKKSRPTKPANQHSNTCGCRESGSQRHQKENEDEIMSDGEHLPNDMKTSADCTRAARRRQAAHKKTRPGRKPWC